MEDRGCVIGLQDGRLVSVRDHEVVIEGERRRLRRDDPARPIACDVCEKAMVRYHAKNDPHRLFIRHRAGEAHVRPELSYAPESNRHLALKTYISDSYNFSPNWSASTERHTTERSRRPDVSCFPRTRRRSGRKRLIERVPTAYEVQLSNIGPSEIRDRTLDHRSEGLEATFWLEAGSEPRWRPEIAAGVTLTDDDRVVGIAVNVDERWDLRDWHDPIDLDAFCELHRRGDIVWVPNYGVLTFDAWYSYVNGDGIEQDERKRDARRSIDATEHRTRHQEAASLLERYAWFDPSQPDRPELLPDTLDVPRGYRRTVTGGLWYVGLEADERTIVDDAGLDTAPCTLCGEVSSRRSIGMHYTLVHDKRSTEAPFSGPV